MRILKKIILYYSYKWLAAREALKEFVHDNITSHFRAPSPSETYEPVGFHGALDAEAAILFEDERVILSVEYDFTDMPIWVEGIEEGQIIRIAQASGDTADLKLTLPLLNKEELLKTKRIALITGKYTERILQYVRFTFREN